MDFISLKILDYLEDNSYYVDGIEEVGFSDVFSNASTELVNALEGLGITQMQDLNDYSFAFYQYNLAPKEFAEFLYILIHY
jgi:hypothetical protein